MSELLAQLRLLQDRGLMEHLQPQLIFKTLGVILHLRRNLARAWRDVVNANAVKLWEVLFAKLGSPLNAMSGKEPEEYRSSYFFWKRLLTAVANPLSFLDAYDPHCVLP